MSNITNYLNKIKTAIYGKDVRGAIHDAIKQVYDDASVNHGNANMEVVLARGEHNTLNDRLNHADQVQAQTNAKLSTVNVNALADSIVQRNEKGNVWIGQVLNFSEVNFDLVNRIGGISIETGSRKLRHNHIPVGSSEQTAYDIHTQQTMPYEVGSFTPEVGSTSGGTMVGTRTGRYIRIGDNVTVHCEIKITNAGTVTGGTLTIGGFPFSNANAVNHCSGSFGDVVGISNYEVYPYLLAGSHLLRIRRREINTGLSTYMPALDMVGATIAFTLTYMTN